MLGTFFPRCYCDSEERHINLAFRKHPLWSSTCHCSVEYPIRCVIFQYNLWICSFFFYDAILRECTVTIRRSMHALLQTEEGNRNTGGDQLKMSASNNPRLRVGRSGNLKNKFFKFRPSRWQRMYDCFDLLWYPHRRHSSTSYWLSMITTISNGSCWIYTAWATSHPGHSHADTAKSSQRKRI